MAIRIPICVDMLDYFPSLGEHTAWSSGEGEGSRVVCFPCSSGCSILSWYFLKSCKNTEILLHKFCLVLTGMMKSKLAWDSTTGRDYGLESLSRSPRLQYKRGRPSSHVTKSTSQSDNKRPTTVRTQRPRTSYILITVSKQHCLRLKL